MVRGAWYVVRGAWCLKKMKSWSGFGKTFFPIFFIFFIFSPRKSKNRTKLN